MTQVPSGFRTSGKRSSKRAVAIPGKDTQRRKKRTVLGSHPCAEKTHETPRKSIKSNGYVRSSGGWCAHTGDRRYLRKERTEPFSNFGASMQNADNPRGEDSARGLRRKPKPTSHSAPRLNFGVRPCRVRDDV